MPIDSIGSPALWAGFIALVTAMLALDLGLFHKEAHEVSMKEAAGWSLVWAIFAVDSIPAIFAVTRDPFIVFTSNIFAILGLRSLYFLLAGVVQKFHYLKVGLSLVLVFVGAKMVAIEWVKVPI